MERIAEADLRFGDAERAVAHQMTEIAARYCLALKPSTL